MRRFSVFFKFILLSIKAETKRSANFLCVVEKTIFNDLLLLVNIHHHKGFQVYNHLTSNMLLLSL